jgi:hypothetical protein
MIAAFIFAEPATLDCSHRIVQNRATALAYPPPVTVGLVFLLAREGASQILLSLREKMNREPSGRL